MIHSGAARPFHQPHSGQRRREHAAHDLAHAHHHRDGGRHVMRPHRLARHRAHEQREESRQHPADREQRRQDPDRPSKNSAPKGRITPMKEATIITGLRPNRSEMPLTAKLPTAAETPSTAISQPHRLRREAAHRGQEQRHERPAHHQIGHQQDRDQPADHDVALARMKRKRCAKLSSDAPSCACASGSRTNSHKSSADARPGRAVM